MKRGRDARAPARAAKAQVTRRDSARDRTHAPSVARSAPPAPADAASALRAAGILWAALAVLAIARAALVFVPGMWWWGGNTLRFIVPAWGWGLWPIAVALLFPPLARRVEPAASRAGDALVTHAFIAVLAAAAVALLVWSFPDRLYFVGDFMLRLGGARGQLPPEKVFPQAMPLDLWLHHRMPVWVHGAFGTDPLDTERALGALKAALLAVLSVAWARVLRLRGAAALAAAAIVLFGGYLGLFTGFGKALGELVVITACVGVCAVWVSLDGRGLVPMGIALALGILLHRSGVLLLAPAAVAWAAWFARFGRNGAWKRWPVALALALPLAALALAAPHMLAAFSAIDRQHLALGSAASPAGGWTGALAALVAPLHLIDSLNQILLLSPLAVALPLVALPLLAHARRRPDGAVVGAFALIATLTLLLVHPRQGELRDWDVFAPSAVALSLAVAWAVGETLRGSPRHAWLGPAIVWAALAPSLGWLEHNSRMSLGVARVRAYLLEAPRRPDAERAEMWAWLGERHLAQQEREASAEAYQQAAVIAPSPRFLFDWGMAEADLGHFREAQAILRRAAARAPNLADTWVALATVTAQLGDLPAAREDAHHALKLDPRNREATDLLRMLERPDSLDVARPPPPR